MHLKTATNNASQSVAKGKKRLLVNTAANVFSVVVQSLITFLLAPYLIGELGTAAYGMIALANTIPAYIQLFTKSISNSVFRFVAVHHNEEQHSEANEYFNTAFGAILLINVPMLVFAVLVSVSFSNLFEVPAGMEFETNLLAFAVFLSCLVGTSSAILKVPYLLTHNFLLQNLLLVSARILSLAILLSLFWVWGANLIFVGIYQLTFQVFVVLFLFFCRKRLDSDIKINWSQFRKKKLRKLLGFGRWVFVNDIAVLLYLAFGFLIINKLLGADATGRFGPVMLLNSLLIMVGGALGTALMPLFFSLISFDDKDLLNEKMLQAARVLGFVSGLIVVLISGLSQQILDLWVGEEFVALWPLLWVTSFSTWLGGICFVPSNQIYRALDKVSSIAIWNLVFGVIHIICTIILMTVFDLGLWAFGISYAINFGIKNVVLNCFYTARYLEQSGTELPAIIAKLLVVSLVLASGLFWLASMYPTSWINLILFSSVTVGIYLFSSSFVLAKRDRSMIQNLVKTRPVSIA